MLFQINPYTLGLIIAISTIVAIALIVLAGESLLVDAIIIIINITLGTILVMMLYKKKVGESLILVIVVSIILFLLSFVMGLVFGVILAIIAILSIFA